MQYNTGIWFKVLDLMIFGVLWVTNQFIISCQFIQIFKKYHPNKGGELSGPK